MAYLVRCLFWHEKEQSYRVDGRAKASWIADTFGLSRRAVISARKRLVELGLLAEVPAAQWELNKWGGRYVFVTSWSQAPKQEASSRIAPPQPRIDAGFAPLGKQITSSKEEDLKNRKPTPAGTSGLSKEKGGSVRAPNLNDIQPADLKSTERLLELHEQARTRKLAPGGESGLLDFLSLAERARAHGQNPVRLFAWLISRQRFDLIGHADEESAAARLREHRFGGGGEGRDMLTSLSFEPTKPLEGDAKIVATVFAVSSRYDFEGDPFDLLVREKPEWTRERWNQAETEYWSWQHSKAQSSFQA